MILPFDSESFSWNSLLLQEVVVMRSKVKQNSKYFILSKLTTFLLTYQFKKKLVWEPNTQTAPSGQMNSQVKS